MLPDLKFCFDPAAQTSTGFEPCWKNRNVFEVTQQLYADVSLVPRHSLPQKNES